MVFMPSTATSATAGAGGKHKFFNWTNPATNKSTKVRYAWVLNNSSIDFVTAVFSHELVEAYTDPKRGPTSRSSRAMRTTGTRSATSAPRWAMWMESPCKPTGRRRTRRASFLTDVDHGFPHGVPPAGARLKVIGIRRTYSKNQRLYFISELRAQAPNGDTFHMSRTEGETSILQKKNTYSTCTAAMAPKPT